MRRRMTPREREALTTLKTEVQLAELTASALGDGFAEAAHQFRLFGYAMMKANAATGGTLFHGERD